MKLTEYKGKQLLAQCGVAVPASMVATNKTYGELSYDKEQYRLFFAEHGGVIIKAQVIGGKRKKGGLVVPADTYEASLTVIDELYQKQYNGQPIDTLLIEKRLSIAEEYFLVIRFDTTVRQPVIIFSNAGGIEVESEADSTTLIQYPVSAVDGLHDFEARAIAQQAGFTGGELLALAQFIGKTYQCFKKYDCMQLEINPVIKTADGVLYAGDAKITIDDAAVARQPLIAQWRETGGEEELTALERAARKIDQQDYRGVAGKTFVELGGDIAVLASGGGASLTCMDAIIEAGGKPANYTEYSGNPSREKVKLLTAITLSKPGLNGCLLIGGTANFTDIFETLSGFTEALLETQPKPTYPIVIRRAGPRDKEAFAMVEAFAKEHGFDITLFNEETPMTLAAKVAVEKVAEYKK